MPAHSYACCAAKAGERNRRSEGRSPDGTSADMASLWSFGGIIPFGSKQSAIIVPVHGSLLQAATLVTTTQSLDHV